MSERILLADDEETFLFATADLLRKEGYTCDCALDGSSAIAKLQEHRYSLLISDIKMPGNPNLELIQLLPQLAPGVPVILVTGYPTLRSAVHAIQLPVAAYLTKPLEFDDLLRQVRAALLRFRADQTLRTMSQQVQEWSLHLLEMERTLPFAPRGTMSTSPPTLPSLSNQKTRSHVSTTQDTKGQLPALPELHTLTAREWEVLRCLWAHQTVTTIAQSLFVSKHTVRNHLKAIFRKVGVHSQFALLEWLTKKIAEYNEAPGNS